ncbi:MAG TPA: type II toxin-antitoxin system CcdA family antitoxin [Alphaproteobacteria bacterium]|nr:type II toxin-antitoxin system CcdA family antitoxin [Alphaproteobacteria bacterium]MDX9704035.1 type II toxin-antitoxin system CcdA family antitoxin [Candidatus Auribacterota bacterium]HOO50202.1 type II toxin-antitoxin system CcdA family antitoxin [Alphaproteobacteria bacterium]
MQIHNEEASRRRPVNLTIREDLLKEAKELNLNASKAAESGIIVAIQKAQEDLWLEQNKKAIESYNRDIEERGLLLKPSWLKDK